MNPAGALPPVDELTEPWWAATRVRRLLVQRCGACGAAQHYPRRLCVACGALDGLAWIVCAGVARLDAYTVVHRAPSPGFTAPYVLARVRLAEGPMMLTNLVDVEPLLDDADALFAAPLTLTWRPLADGRNLPAFTVDRRSTTTQGA